MIAFYIILTLLGVLLFYLITRLHKLEIIKNIKEKTLSWIIACSIVALGIILSFIFGIVIVVFMLHLALFFIIGDMLYILLKLLKLNIKYNTIGIIVFFITGTYLFYAYLNAVSIRETNYIINTQKSDEEISIIQMTDVHLGTTIDGKKFNDYIKRISKTYPDIIVITGDFVDEKTPYEDMINGCKALGKARTKYGVYMVLGNHDLNAYGGNKNYYTEDFILELQKNNVNILQDNVVLINDQFYLIGRKDKTVSYRESVKELTENIDKDKIVILLDHQPVDFAEIEKANIDLMLSGHTHGGQMFPLAYIGEIISENEMTYGLEKRESTNFIVSSGMSGWGIPFKTGTISEYVHIKIK